LYWKKIGAGAPRHRFSSPIFACACAKIPAVMSRSCIPIITILFLASSALAQSTPSDANTTARDADQQRQQDLAETKRAFDRMSEQQPRPSFSPLPNRSGSAERSRFYAAVPEFRAATAAYRDAIGLNPDLSKTIKALERLIDPLREYLESVSAKPTAADHSDLKELSPKELIWETLTTAETIDNNLQIARRAVQQSDRDGTMSIKLLQFFVEIQSDLNRLRYLASRARR
jgi:hypothetical protein